MINKILGLVLVALLIVAVGCREKEIPASDRIVGEVTGFGGTMEFQNVADSTDDEMPNISSKASSNEHNNDGVSSSIPKSSADDSNATFDNQESVKSDRITGGVIVGEISEEYRPKEPPSIKIQTKPNPKQESTDEILSRVRKDEHQLPFVYAIIFTDDVNYPDDIPDIYVHTTEVEQTEDELNIVALEMIARLYIDPYYDKAYISYEIERIK